MKIFFDFEFIETAGKYPLAPISLGIIREDGKTYYAEWDTIPWENANEWVMENIRPTIWQPNSQPPKSASLIAQEVTQFVGTYPEFWGYFCAFDWVLMCDLMSGFLKTPPTWPHIAFDIRQRMMDLKVSREDLNFIKNEQEHHALADAVWNRSVDKFLDEVARGKQAYFD